MASAGSDSAQTTAATGPVRRASVCGTSITEAPQLWAVSSQCAVAWTRRSAGNRGCATTMMSPACDVAAKNNAGSPLTISNNRVTPSAAAASSSSRRASAAASRCSSTSLPAIQLLPNTSTKTELANERQRRKFGQRVVLHEHAVQREPKHLREFCRRADEHPLGCPVMQMQDDATLLRFGCHAHVPPGAKACRTLANAPSRSSTTRFTLPSG